MAIEPVNKALNRHSNAFYSDSNLFIYSHIKIIFTYSNHEYFITENNVMEEASISKSMEFL